jgi:putative Mn2+ efflux pump MntP
MQFWEIFLLAVGLAFDAFAVSICKGVASKKSYLKTGLVCGAWFGIFQGLMPLLGYFLGQTVANFIEQFKGYVAFVLLAFLGVKMIVEAVKDIKEGTTGCRCCESEKLQEFVPAPTESKEDASLAPFVMLTMAIATSIDALATGLIFDPSNVIVGVTTIGLVTFICCFIGSIIGAKVGDTCKTKAEIAGGAVLVALGVKFLIEQLIFLF